MESFGLARGKASACCSYNEALDARCVVHGDGFAFAGYDTDLDLVEQLMEEMFLCKVEGRSAAGPRTCAK
eukprot:12816819-Alexandrium_andersonii.AAC.1